MKRATTLLFILVTTLICQPLWAYQEDPGSGALLLRFDQQPVRWVAPTLDTDVTITVNGPIVRALVKQRFHNPSKQWAEASYLFPLPEDAAVDQMRLRVGERIIEGVIKERQQAKKIYEQAKRQGKRASLVEQQRPNMFTTNVANIPPGEYVVVEIEYQHSVARTDNRYSLRYPMAITPRYTPGQAIPDAAFNEPQNSLNNAQYTTPWPQTAGGANPTRIQIDLNPGFELALAHSTSHQLQTTERQPTRRKLLLSEPLGTTVSDRDFLLHWQPVESQQPQVALFTQQKNGEQYGLLQITPPELQAGAVRLPRDVVFVIDTSGSMGGEPIRQAKDSLLWALQRLQPEDRFNIVQFNSVTHSLFSDVQQAIPGVLSRAQRYVQNLQSTGGTEMLAAVDASLCQDCTDANRVRQVIFITDGAIGNEDQLFRAIRANIGDTRLFTVGIGSAPNSYFMRRAAEFGRGTFTYIASAGEVQQKMEQLYRKLEAPVLTDLQLDLPHDPNAELLPSPLPDLYAGEPLVAVVKMAPSAANISVSGRAGNVIWQQEFELLEGEQRAGVHQLWARQKIQQLNDLRRNQYDSVAKDDLRQQIVALSLKHHLVSPFTSLVAVDVTPVRKSAEALKKHKVASNAPKGTQFALPQTATAASLWLQLALICLVLAVLFWAAQYRVRFGLVRPGYL